MPSHINRLVLVASLWVVACVNSAQGTSVSEIISSIPKCALPCVIQDLTEAKCSMTDVASLSDCICLDTKLLSGLSECIQTSCVYSDQLIASSAADSLCTAYPKESRVRDVQIAAIVTMALAIPIVLARCAARLQITKKLWLDDWTALLGLVLLTALAAMEYISSRMGFGKHYWNISASNGPVLLQLFYAAQILYITVQLSAKVSIALLFFRLFPARWMRLTLKIFTAFMIGHGLIFVMVVIFQCWPIYSIWDKTVSGKCVDITAVGYVGAALSIVEDIFLVLLPITELRKLQVSQRQRVLLSLMFAIGSFAAVTSMIRLKYMVMFAYTFDATWDNVDVIIWSLIELFTAVFLGSLPPLRPWLIRLVPKVYVTWTKTRTNKSTSGFPQSGHNATTDKDAESKSTAAIYDEPSAAPVYGDRKTSSSSYAMSTISSMRSADWNITPESPPLLPTSKFQNPTVAIPQSVRTHWSGQPGNPTNPNVLTRSTSHHLNRVASQDLESNHSRDTWSNLGGEGWTQSAADRLSSKFAGPRGH
ncbi:hypothetical protein PFICI_11277 [Pestalotiopsis fici W106-1]|uniref:CFEM domain-containing protein n=1 Tax=Pestalotiopsis fici (strain W106-1 / CGMCC3.15140) TaxID=1229662 RepID=W3WU46_PESFW|nr:uncharacterized protein PFICI_11277 [Pestalotiopsis fici W106-1]ETS77403.1 hypothetical protein PFICI_11277 [Pestalotiopsis fici W106-1]